jgi:hypothetical protein
MPKARLFNRRSLIKHLGTGGILLAASFGSPFQTFAQFPGPRTFGIDVSKWGAEIDWSVVVSKLNPRFVFVQAYHIGKDEASCYANLRFANYRRALQRLGLLHGAYLRCHPNAGAEPGNNQVPLQVGKVNGMVFLSTAECRHKKCRFLGLQPWISQRPLRGDSSFCLSRLMPPIGAKRTSSTVR